MTLKAFRVTGTFQMGHITSPFSVETVGSDETAARDRVYSTIGSRHRANRYQIKITKVEPVANDKVTDLVVEKRLSMVK